MNRNGAYPPMTARYGSGSEAGVRTASHSRALLFSSIWLSLLVVPIATAHANLIFTLDSNNCSGNCGPSPYGTIQVSTDSVDHNAIDFKIILASNVVFHQTTSPAQHPSIALNINQANVTFSNFKLDGNAVVPPVSWTSNGPVSPQNLGNFNYSLALSTPGNSQSGVLTFTANPAAGHSLSPTDVVMNNKGNFALVDIIYLVTGATGNTFVTKGGRPIPEPSLIGSFMAAIGMLGLIRRRR